MFHVHVPTLTEFLQHNNGGYGPKAKELGTPDHGFHGNLEQDGQCWGKGHSNSQA